jgi:protein-tyrosine phosphatase
MKSVLFVCLGNICRSPLAEGILRHKAEQKGINLKIDSAGTESIHVGEHPDRRAQRTAKDHDIDISRLVARQVKSEDFGKFDMILVANAEVYNELMHFVRNENEKRKIDFIMNVVQPGSNVGVPDPYYGGQEGFEKVYEMLDKACDAILKKV